MRLLQAKKMDLEDKITLYHDKPFFVCRKKAKERINYRGCSTKFTHGICYALTVKALKQKNKTGIPEEEERKMSKKRMQKVILEDKEKIFSLVVPSNTMREYLGQQGIRFSDAQLAALLFYQDRLDWDEKNDMIETLKVITEDNKLKAYLDGYIVNRRHAYTAFESEEQDYIYVLEHRQKGFDRWWLDGFYRDFDYITQLREQFRGCEIRIRKQSVICGEEDFYLQEAGDCLVMDDGFAILSFGSYILQYGKEHLNDVFSRVNFQIDHPFQKGNIVKNLLTGQYGIVMTTDIEEESEISDEKMLPFQELKLSFCALTDKGWSWNNKVSPFFLDKESLPEDDSWTELLKEASSILRNDTPNFGLLQGFIEHT